MRLPWLFYPLFGNWERAKKVSPETFLEAIAWGLRV